MQRSRLRQHAEVDHREDGWRIRFWEMDPTLGFFLVATIAGLATFAAVIAERERWLHLLGGKPPASEGGASS